MSIFGNTPLFIKYDIPPTEEEIELIRELKQINKQVKRRKCIKKINTYTNPIISRLVEYVLFVQYIFVYSVLIIPTILLYFFYKRQATSDKRQATSDKRQATSDKRQSYIFRGP